MKAKFNTIKKSRKKSKDIDEKIEYLNKECQKTGLNEIMSTSGIYFSTGQEPNPAHATFGNTSFNGKPLSPPVSFFLDDFRFTLLKVVLVAITPSIF